MRLPAGQFFGTTARQFACEGLLISLDDYAPQQEQPWHTHERVTFFAHLTGEQIDEGKYWEAPLTPLALIFHPDSVLHRSRLGPRGARGMNLELSNDWLERHGVARADLGPHRVVTNEAVHAAVLRLIRAYAPDPLPGGALSDCVLELVECFTSETTGDERWPSWLPHVEARIANGFREPIGLASLSIEAGVHPIHLARVFRRRHGCSVGDRVQALRLRAAVSQILDGDSLGRAAIDAGFADQSHFSRTLKAHYGYGPLLIKRLAS